jgi:hypothetical protein
VKAAQFRFSRRGTVMVSPKVWRQERSNEDSAFSCSQ